MSTVERLRELLSSYATSENPRARITLLRYAVETVEELGVDEGITAPIKARLSVLSSRVNWEAMKSYALGKWEALKDPEYFKYAELITEMDEIAAALWRAAEKYESGGM